MRPVPSLQGVGRGLKRLVLPGITMALMASLVLWDLLGEEWPPPPKHHCSASLKVPKKVRRCFGSCVSQSWQQRCHRLAEYAWCARHHSKLLLCPNLFEPLWNAMRSVFYRRKETEASSPVLCDVSPVGAEQTTQAGISIAALPQFTFLHWESDCKDPDVTKLRPGGTWWLSRKEISQRHTACGFNLAYFWPAHKLRMMSRFEVTGKKKKSKGEYFMTWKR